MVTQFLYGEDALDVTRLMYLTKFDFSARNYRALLSKYRPEIALQVVEASKGAAATRCDHGARQRLNVFGSWLFTCASLAPKYLKKAKKRGDGVDPVLSKLSPSVHLGSVSEAFHNTLEKVRQITLPMKEHSAAQFIT